VRLTKHRTDLDYKFVLNSALYQARDEIALYAVRNNYDYVLMCDSDATFEPEYIDYLLEDDKDIVGGVSVKRGYPYEPIIYNYEDGKWVTQPIPTELTRVDVPGMGMTLFKTDVFRKVQGLFEPTMHWTEDFAFFFRAKQQGVEAWIDPRVDLGHVGMEIHTKEWWNA